MMDFTGKVRLGFIVRIKGGLVVAWRRGGAPVAVEKIEQASSAMIFSGTARRQGLRLAEE